MCFIVIAQILRNQSEVSDDSSITLIYNALGSPGILCILGARLMINLKEAGRRDMNDDTTAFSGITLATIQFELNALSP